MGIDVIVPSRKDFVEAELLEWLLKGEEVKYYWLEEVTEAELHDWLGGILTGGLSVSFEEGHWKSTSSWQSNPVLTFEVDWKICQYI